MIACWQCRNLHEFVQVSDRADARAIRVGLDGLSRGAWELDDTRPEGLYCAACAAPVQGDVATLGLTDARIGFVPPEDFDAAAVAKELAAIRPDATWTTFDIPARPARHGEARSKLHPSVRAGLERIGALPLYTHQAEAIDAAMDGHGVVQATPAGSGKSVGFLAPVLDALQRDAHATAILCFPLRALAGDQLNGLSRWGVVESPWLDWCLLDLQLPGDATPVRVGRYDGATPEHRRRQIRREARLLITTPDSIHHSLLRKAKGTYADGTSWERILRGLRYVVLDEIHTYQGVFGSNVGQVLRRLRRAATWYGAEPDFLTASATIGNPGELAARLTGIEMGWRVIDDDGAPTRARKVLICNPPHAKQPRQRQDADAEPTASAQRLPDRLTPQTIALDLVPKGALASAEHPPVRTICFERSRIGVFALEQRIKAKLKELRREDLASTVASYAATFLAEDRAAQEQRLRDGSILAITSTNALELGIDIPDLSLAVLCGYPGQISSFRQRAGRVGRAGEGVVVLVVGNDPLQQFLASHPKELEKLLHARAEDVVVNPDAEAVVEQYGLRAAEADLGGIAREDRDYFGADRVNAWLRSAHGSPAFEHRGQLYWSVSDPDQEAYANLRSTAGHRTFTVLHVNGREQKEIGTLDEGSAPRDAFVPAIWTTPEHTYEVVGFDRQRGEIYCEGPRDFGYLTRGMPKDRVEVVADLAPERSIAGLRVGYSRLAITRQVFSYKKVQASGAEDNHQVEQMWPPVDFATEGMRMTIPLEWCAGQGWEVAEAIRGFEHVLLALAPSVVACDPIDLDAASEVPTAYLYDSFGGGIGMSRPAFERFDEIVALGRQVVEACPCDHGCWGCVALGRRPDGNDGVSKKGALHLLAHIASVLDDPNQ